MLLGAALRKSWCFPTGVAAGDDSDEKVDEGAVLQGEAAGKEAYKRVQASSAAAIQRQKAVRSQVNLQVPAYGVWPAPQARPAMQQTCHSVLSAGSDKAPCTHACNACVCKHLLQHSPVALFSVETSGGNWPLSHGFLHLRRLWLWQGLRSLQPRIQAWLGRAAAAADALVVHAVTSQAAPDAHRELARWDPDNKLGLTMPFPGDTSLVVWLDKALPQVLPPQPHMCCLT